MYIQTLFLSDVNSCYDNCAAADKQQSYPQGKVAVVTRLWRSAAGRFVAHPAQCIEGRTV